LKAPTGWTADDWINLAGVLVAGLGVIGTLVGTFLGSRLSQRAERQGRAAEAAQQRQLEVDHALTRVDLALSDMDPVRLEDEALSDRSMGHDRFNETLEALRDGEFVRQARDALALVSVRHPDKQVRSKAEDLARAITSVRRVTTRWFHLRAKQIHGTANAAEMKNIKTADKYVTEERQWATDLRHGLEKAAQHYSRQSPQ
jgi:hypothetical protein